MIGSRFWGGDLSTGTKSVHPSSAPDPWSLSNAPPRIDLNLSDPFSPSYHHEEYGSQCTPAKKLPLKTPRGLGPEILDQPLTARSDSASEIAATSYHSGDSHEARRMRQASYGNGSLFGDLDAASRQPDRPGGGEFSGRVMPWRSVTPHYQHNLRLGNFRQRGMSSSMGLGLSSPPRNVMNLQGLRDASPSPIQDESLWLTLSQASDQFTFPQPAVQTLGECSEKPLGSAPVPPLVMDKVLLGESELLVKSPARRPGSWDARPAEGVSVTNYRTGRQSTWSNHGTSGSWSFRSADSSALETAPESIISNIGYTADFGAVGQKKSTGGQDFVASCHRLLLTDPGADGGTPTDRRTSWTLTQSDLTSSIEPSNVGNNVMAMWETSDIVGPLSPGGTASLRSLAQPST